MLKVSFHLAIFQKKNKSCHGYWNDNGERAESVLSGVERIVRDRQPTWPHSAVDPLPSPPMKIAIIKRTNESEFSQEGVEKGNSPALPVGM